MPSVYLADFPEPDRIEGAPHPRETARLFAHAAAQAEFLASFNSGRLHHAWLISGPRGIGKATFAWMLARFLLAVPPDEGMMFAPSPPETLDIPFDHPVAHRMRALSEPGLFLLRRGLNEKEVAPAQDILVKEVRKMTDYFHLSLGDGGRRVSIIDAADDLNPNAANALLKLLEEPPKGVTFFLISHQPQRLLPTIRSRCRELRLAPLPPDMLADALSAAGGTLAPAEVQAIAELAGGSVGEAFRLTNLDGLAVYTRLIKLFTTLPRLDRPEALQLSETAAGRGAETQFDLVVTLIDLFLARLARAAATATLPPEAALGEAALITRLGQPAGAALAWADLAQSLTIRARRGRAVNLDPAALLMDMLLKIDETAGTLLAQR
jgi:DNA polymerase III subunit delta'